LHDVGEYRAIKQHWLENVYFLLQPFTKVDWMPPTMPVDYVWYMFLLRKS
jgi:hypothetical protein